METDCPSIFFIAISKCYNLTVSSCNLLSLHCTAGGLTYAGVLSYSEGMKSSGYLGPGCEPTGRGAALPERDKM